MAIGPYPGHFFGDADACVGNGGSFSKFVENVRGLMMTHQMGFRWAALVAVAMGLVGATCNSSLAATFYTPGNLAVLRADGTTNNTTATILQIDSNTANQAAPVNSVSIPDSGSDALRISGSATSTAYLSHTNDGKLLTFTGHNSSTTSGNINAITLRGVGTVDAGGNYVLATTYTGGGGDQTRSASSFDNTTWFIGDQGGMFTNGTNSASPSGNIRGVKAFGGAMYVFTASNGVPAVNTINLPSGGTLSSLPGLPNNANSNGQDFYLIQSGDNSSLHDVLYLLSASSNSAGIISKFSLVAGSWAANGTYATNFGGFGLAARDSGAGAELFVTSGQGALAANRVVKLFDRAGYNATIDIDTASNYTLFTTPTGSILKGIDFVPVPEPGAIALLLVGVVGSLGFRSRYKM